MRVLVVRKLDERRVTVSLGTLQRISGEVERGPREEDARIFTSTIGLQWALCHVSGGGGSNPHAEFGIRWGSPLVDHIMRSCTIVDALSADVREDRAELMARHEQLKRDLRGERRRRQTSERTYQRILGALINREHLDTLVAALRGERSDESPEGVPSSEVEGLDCIVRELDAIRHVIEDIDRSHDANDRHAVSEGLRSVHNRLSLLFAPLQNLRESRPHAQIAPR